MPQASQLSPDVTRGLLLFARALVGAVRNRTLYPPEHPAVAASVERLIAAIRESSLGAAFTIGVTPDTRLIEGVEADATQAGIAGAAALLHDRDILTIRGMAAAFDDVKVAQLLATALALDGQASDRPATIFNTIAPDEDRKRRVLTLTRSLLSETDFGRSGQFQALWASAEALLVSYNDTPFVSESDRNALDGIGARAERLSALDLPPELPEWMDSLGQDNVRLLI
jgi:hypothetical protein